MTARVTCPPLVHGYNGAASVDHFLRCRTAQEAHETRSESVGPNVGDRDEISRFHLGNCQIAGGYVERRAQLSGDVDGHLSRTRM